MMKKLFSKASKIQDMEQLADYCTKNFGGKITLSDFLEQSNDYCPEKFSNLYSTLEVVLLKDSTIKDDDAYAQIYSIMKTLSYDNGEPLVSDENDYFEHYDRGQDVCEYYNDVEIYDFITDGENLYIRVDMSLEELKEKLTNEYDGSSYEHDFPER